MTWTAANTVVRLRGEAGRAVVRSPVRAGDRAWARTKTMLGGTDDFELPAVATPAGQVFVRTAGGGSPECGS